MVFVENRGYKMVMNFEINNTQETDAWLSNVEIRQGKYGDYAVGIVSDKGSTYPFKKWGTSVLPEGSYSCIIEYLVYNGSKQCILKTATPIPGSIEDYQYSPYDAKELGSLVSEFMSTLSSKQMNLFWLLMGRSSNGSKKTVEVIPDLFPSFKTEQAAISHHDSYLRGLYAHSYKVARYAKSIIENPLYVFKDLPTDSKELVVLGAFLHDLGKTLEYDHGKVSSVGTKVSHRTLMTERCAQLKDKIVKLYGEDGYWTLISIFEQHHGKYEESPRTIEAYIVHLADNLDAMLTDLSDSIKNKNQDNQLYVGSSIEGNRFKLITPDLETEE
jgi:HD superfamily phosphodiesterase